MRQFGPCFEGCEERFEALLKNQISVCTENFHYLEIGIFQATTFRAVHAILAESQKPFTLLGIEPAFPEVSDRLATLDRSIIFRCTREKAFKLWTHKLDFVLIDGCHCHECVKGDFISVEPFVKIGGIVIFHDFQCETGNIQPHGNADANVRGACITLGLLNDARPGWKLQAEWLGNPVLNGANCGVFQRL